MSVVPDNLKFTKDHEWVLIDDDGNARIGITDYAQECLSDVVFVELPQIGDEFSEGDTMAVAESVKTASDIYAPITGKVIDVNDKLDESPELVNESPYQSGWMVLMKPSGDLGDFLDSKSYRASIG